MKKKSKEVVKKTILCNSVLQDQIIILKDYLDEATEVGAMRRAIANYVYVSDAVEELISDKRMLNEQIVELRKAISNYQKSSAGLRRIVCEEE